jgi:tetrapyrrole methylase family protein/MazG family protein
MKDDPQRQTHQAEELGDLLFSVVNLARFLDIDPEQALSATNRKFVKRFRYIEEQLRLKGRKIEQTGLTEMEILWQEAKKFEK